MKITRIRHRHVREGKKKGVNERGKNARKRSVVGQCPDWTRESKQRIQTNDKSPFSSPQLYVLLQSNKKLFLRINLQGSNGYALYLLTLPVIFGFFCYTIFLLQPPSWEKKIALQEDGRNKIEE